MRFPNCSLRSPKRIFSILFISRIMNDDIGELFFVEILWVECFYVTCIKKRPLQHSLQTFFRTFHMKYRIQQVEKKQNTTTRAFCFTRLLLLSQNLRTLSHFPLFFHMQYKILFSYTAMSTSFTRSLLSFHSVLDCFEKCCDAINPLQN